MKQLLLLLLCCLIPLEVFALTSNERELLIALKTAERYLDNSEDNTTTLLYVPPAQQLRNAADRIEREDRDKEYIRKIIEKYEEER